MQKIIDEAGPVRTFYCLEPMPWMEPTGPEEYMRMIEDIGRERFAVHMDMANWMNGGDRYFRQKAFMDKVFALLGSRIT